jgi:hypothetical protein
MKISFACPACGKSGAADEAFVGRKVQCKACQLRFVIPHPADGMEDAEYLLDEPAGKPSRTEASSLPTEAVFVAARGDEPNASISPRKSRNPSPKARKSRREGTEFAWRTWLTRVGIVAAIALTATALIVPRGVEIVGSILLALGTAMVLIGFAAGAYGAFSEDFLYGFFYLVFPLYSGYYLVTRWEDLWKWCVCSTAGFAFVLVGTQMMRWAGVVE